MKTIIIWTAAIVTIATLAFAGVPQTVNYQGYLKNGSVPASGPVNITFSLYSSNPARSNPVWFDTHSVTPANGIYSVQLGSQKALNASFDVPYWLGITVESTALPLQPLSSVPYALRAAGVDIGTLNLQTGAAGNTGLIVKGARDQTADLQQWQDSSGATVAAISPGGKLTGDGSGLTGLWKTNGNAGTFAGTSFIGTTDNTSLEFRVNNLKGMQILTNNHLVGGYNNLITNTSSENGSVIAGGGGLETYFPYIPLPNTITGSFATISGGLGNGISARYGTISGGYKNYAYGTYATVSGGSNNTARGANSIVSGGATNTAGGDFSWAGGKGAIVRDAVSVGSGTTGDQGTFVWADSQTGNFQSSGQNQFLIRAAGGVGINTNSPTAALEVAGNAKISGMLTANGLSANIVGSAAINDGAVVGSKIATGAVTSDKLATGVIATSNLLADGIVTNSKIKGPIDGSKLQGLSIPGSAIADGAVTNAKISGSIDMSKRPMTVYPLSSNALVINPTLIDYIFAGSTISITTPPYFITRIIGSAVAGGYINSGSAAVYYGLCYRAQGTQTIYNFSASPPFAAMTAIETLLSISNSTELIPGTWDIGFCVKAGVSSIEITSVNGWFMVTN
jgi:hypothetical protein